MQHQARSGAHEPDRPGWSCAGCGTGWPCAAARADLARDFDRFPTSFAAYMAQFYAQAFEDLAASADGVPEDLWDRFMGWLPPRPHRVTPAG
ncbi:hypothetical protein [Actinoplanes sp. NPDC051494]|uniref:hypothetical protein n=1 Tax=Actinoplanes sp. NPDC051494 TaxID=3363907 RepID=UPI00378868ED